MSDLQNPSRRQAIRYLIIGAVEAVCPSLGKRGREMRRWPVSAVNKKRVSNSRRPLFCTAMCQPVTCGAERNQVLL